MCTYNSRYFTVACNSNVFASRMKRGLVFLNLYM